MNFKLIIYVKLRHITLNSKDLYIYLHFPCAVPVPNIAQENVECR